MRKNIILTISPNIRGPLNTISGNAELATDTREKKKRDNHLKNISILCKHILHLLNNLLGRIFFLFQQSIYSANAEGFCLGLSIIKGLVSLLDGTINVVSDVGKGSTFSLSLPIPFPITDDVIEKDTKGTDMIVRRVLMQKLRHLEHTSVGLETFHSLCLDYIKFLPNLYFQPIFHLNPIYT